MHRRVVFNLVLLVFLILPLISGCAYRLGGLTAASTRNVNLNKIDLDTRKQVKGVTGEDSVMILLGIPLGFPTLQGAVDKALESGNGDILIDGVVESRFWTALIIGQISIVVKGNVVNTKEARNDKDL